MIGVWGNGWEVGMESNEGDGRRKGCVCLRTTMDCEGLFYIRFMSTNTAADQNMRQIIIINPQGNGMIFLHFSLRGIKRRKAELELVKNSTKYSLSETALNLQISL